MSLNTAEAEIASPLIEMDQLQTPAYIRAEQKAAFDSSVKSWMNLLKSSRNKKTFFDELTNLTAWMDDFKHNCEATSRMTGDEGLLYMVKLFFKDWKLESLTTVAFDLTDIVIPGQVMDENTKRFRICQVQTVLLEHSKANQIEKAYREALNILYHSDVPTSLEKQCEYDEGYLNKATLPSFVHMWFLLQQSCLSDKSKYASPLVNKFDMYIGGTRYTELINGSKELTVDVIAKVMLDYRRFAESFAPETPTVVQLLSNIAIGFIRDGLAPAARTHFLSKSRQLLGVEEKTGKKTDWSNLYSDLDKFAANNELSVTTECTAGDNFITGKCYRTIHNKDSNNIKNNDTANTKGYKVSKNSQNGNKKKYKSVEFSVRTTPIPQPSTFNLREGHVWCSKCGGPHKTEESGTHFLDNEGKIVKSKLNENKMFENEKSSYIADTGSGVNIENDINTLTDLIPYEVPITGIGNNSINTTGKGKISVLGSTLDSFYIPGAEKILSVKQLTDQGNVICFFSDSIVILNRNKISDMNLI
ncbi:hypothetical protein C6P42_004250, partial [Pichia californica]